MSIWAYIYQCQEFQSLQYDVVHMFIFLLLPSYLPGFAEIIWSYRYSLLLNLFLHSVSFITKIFSYKLHQSLQQLHYSQLLIFKFYWIHCSPFFLVYYIFPYLYILAQFSFGWATSSSNGLKNGIRAWSFLSPHLSPHLSKLS